MSRVFAISDTHGFLPDPRTIPDCDILLHAGDVCPDYHQASFARYGSRTQSFEKGEQRQSDWLNTTFRAWLEALNERGIYVVGIAGNHDFVFEHPSLVPDDLPWVYLRDAVADVHGIRIFGTPWVPKLKRWAFYAGQDALQARADMVPECDILLSHGPPFGLTDRTVPRFGDCHVGDVQLLGAIQRVRPTYVVCGHIHEGYGIDQMEHEDRSTTLVVNAARVDENYSDQYRDPIQLLALLTPSDYGSEA